MTRLANTLGSLGSIAIVDDDEPLREALKSVLKAAGFGVATFASAEDFLSRPRQRDTSVSILDIRLPGMSGIELQSRLALVGNTIPIIFVTAHGDDSVRNAVMEAGAAAFLTKPVRGDRLLKEIYAARQQTNATNNLDRS
jgi:FixJ family two-component response regulator